MLTMASQSSALHLYLQDLPTLLHINRVLANRPAKTGAIFFPMKDLAGSQGHGQLEVWRFDSHQVHCGSSGRASPARTSMPFFNTARRRAPTTYPDFVV